MFYQSSLTLIELCDYLVISDYRDKHKDDRFIIVYSRDQKGVGVSHEIT